MTPFEFLFTEKISHAPTTRPQKDDVETRPESGLNIKGLLAIFFIAAIVAFGGFWLFMTKSDNESDKVAAPAVAQEKSSVAETPAPVKKDDKVEQKNYYGAGDYKIGVDIPADEYLMVGEGYFVLKKDSTGENGTIIVNGNVPDTQRYIEVRDGEYLTISGNLRLYNEKNAPKNDTTEKVHEGQYKVGIDIPEGEYKVTCFERAYIAVEKNSRGSIVTNRVPSGGSAYITVFNGQYLRLSNAEAQLVGKVKR